MPLSPGWPEAQRLHVCKALGISLYLEVEVEGHPTQSVLKYLAHTLMFYVKGTHAPTLYDALLADCIQTDEPEGDI